MGLAIEQWLIIADIIPGIPMELLWVRLGRPEGVLSFLLLAYRAP